MDAQLDIKTKSPPGNLEYRSLLAEMKVLQRYFFVQINEVEFRQLVEQSRRRMPVASGLIHRGNACRPDLQNVTSGVIV